MHRGTAAPHPLRCIRSATSPRMSHRGLRRGPTLASMAWASSPRQCSDVPCRCGCPLPAGPGKALNRRVFRARSLARVTTTSPPRSRRPPLRPVVTQRLPDMGLGNVIWPLDVSVASSGGCGHGWALSLMPMCLDGKGKNSLPCQSGILWGVVLDKRGSIHCKKGPSLSRTQACLPLI